MKNYDEEEMEEDFSYLNFMRRDCYLLAEVLHNITDLPLIGIWDGNDLHHAAVYNPDQNIYIDKRGELNLEEFVQHCAGQTVRPVDLEEIFFAATGRVFDPEYPAYSPEEYEYAEQWAWDNLGDIISQYP